LLKNLYIIPRYLMAIVFPLKLNAYYTVPDHYGTKWILILVAWAVLSAFMVLLWKKHRVAARFGLFWFVVNFVPISNIIAIPSAPMAERYMYTPAIGLWLIAADLFCILYERRTCRKAVVSCGVLIVICASAITFSRNVVWRDNITFYTEMVKMNPDSELAHFSLGLAFMDRGDITGAQTEWKRTIEINPNYFNVLSLLGQSYLMQNSLRDAEYYYSMALAADPDKTDALYNLAVIKEKLLKPQEALYYYERFLESPSNQYAKAVEIARERVPPLKEGDK
jgi:tetratricopeptide (TPR) repeat protein